MRNDGGGEVEALDLDFEKGRLRRRYEGEGLQVFAGTFYTRLMTYWAVAWISIVTLHR